MPRRRLSQILGALAILIAPAAASADAGRLAAANTARNSGDWSTATALLRIESAEHPLDADLLRLLGTTLSFARQYPEALVILRRARALAPADTDVALALARTSLWAGELTDAARIEASLAEHDPTNQEVRELALAIVSARNERPALAIGIAQSFSSVRIGLGRADWYTTQAAVSVPLGQVTGIAGDLEREDRSGAVDTRVGLQIDHRIGKAALYIGGAATPRAKFRELWSLRAGADVPVAANLSFLLDARHAHYRLTDITVAEPGVSVHSADRRVAVELHSINLFESAGPRQSGWSTRLSFETRARLDLFAGAATYPDTEAGVTRRVHSAFGGLGAPLGAAFRVQILADHEERFSSYCRNGVTIGLRWTPGR